MDLVDKLTHDPLAILSYSIFSSSTFVIVEDSMLVFETILDRLFPEKTFDVRDGICKTTLIEYHNLYESTKTGKEKILFIPDLDTEIDKPHSSNNFIYLEKYCIENYLLCESCLSDCFRNLLRLEKQNSNFLKLDNFIGTCETLFFELYVNLYITQRYELCAGLDGSSLSPYLKKNTLKLDKINFNRYVKKIRLELGEMYLDYDDILAKSIKEINKFHSANIDLINGKYIFELLKIHLLNLNNDNTINSIRTMKPSLSLSSLSLESEKLFIAQKISLDRFDFLKYSINYFFNSLEI